MQVACQCDIASHSYRIMQNCWNKHPDERPPFSEILKYINSYVDHLNTSSDSSGDESDEEGMERQDSMKSEPSHQTDRGKHSSTNSKQLISFSVCKHGLFPVLNELVTLLSL